MTDKDAYHSLLLQKKELVFRLLRMMNDAALKEASVEKNAERYIGLVEAREEIIGELKKLDGEMEQLGKLPSMSEETALLGQQIREMTDQIARLEPGIRKKASGIAVNLQRQISDINERKKISGLYEPGRLYESRV